MSPTRKIVATRPLPCQVTDGVSATAALADGVPAAPTAAIAVMSASRLRMTLRGERRDTRPTFRTEHGNATGAAHGRGTDFRLIRARPFARSAGFACRGDRMDWRRRAPWQPAGRGGLSASTR